MGSVKDLGRDLDHDWFARYYEKQRNCKHEKVERMKYRWYNTCVECGKRIDEQE